MRTPAKLRHRPWLDQVEIIAGDLADIVARDLPGTNEAYYLAHSIPSIVICVW